MSNSSSSTTAGQAPQAAQQRRLLHTASLLRAGVAAVAAGGQGRLCQQRLCHQGKTAGAAVQGHRNRRWLFRRRRKSWLLL